jgi:hypothetical protein
MFRASPRALTPLTLEQILAQPQPQPLNSDEARTVAQELVLLLMASVKPGSIDPMKYWERARSALLAGAEAQDVERMAGVMADKLEVEQLPQHVCSSLCSIFDRLRDPVVCARFLSDVRAPGMGAVIVGLARVTKQGRASPTAAQPAPTGQSTPTGQPTLAGQPTPTGQPTLAGQPTPTGQPTPVTQPSDLHMF